MRIKLAAIAKDEAAYLSEWIYHHLRMGFDNIDIYVNNTTDNTLELAEKLVDLENVKFLDGDDIFKNFPFKPQEAAYKDALNKARSDKFTHLMFLDIDEFWLSRDLNNTIKDCLFKLNHPKVLSFGWFLKHDEGEFSLPLEQTLIGKCDPHVKTVFETSCAIQSIDVHNVRVNKVDYLLGDGRKWAFGKYTHTSSSVMGEAYFNNNPAEFFVCHRVYRSMLEYVSLLSRSRPINYNSGNLFKGNRFGYIDPHSKKVEVKFNEVDFQAYVDGYHQFVELYHLTDIIEAARVFVRKRYQSTLKLINNMKKNDIKLVKKLAKHVDLADFKAALSASLLRIANEERDLSINKIRDLAVNLESTNVELALELMAIAQKYRPEGSFISKKIKAYNKTLNDLFNNNNG